MHKGELVSFITVCAFYFNYLVAMINHTSYWIKVLIQLIFFKQFFLINQILVLIKYYYLSDKNKQYSFMNKLFRLLSYEGCILNS